VICGKVLFGFFTYVLMGNRRLVWGGFGEDMNLYLQILKTLYKRFKGLFFLLEI
jgi:hypothetical protein